MKIPSTIKVGCHMYKVEFPIVNRGSIGETHNNLNTIRIADTSGNGKMPESSIVQTLMHEIIHAIDRKSNLCVFSKYNEGPDESKVDGFAEWLCMVLYDNPKLLDLFKR